MTIFAYSDGNAPCEGYIAVPPGAGPHPAVLIAHNWAGQSSADTEIADKLAALGYIGIAIDVYGKGVRGGLTSDNSALMAPWMQDRTALRSRLLAAVEAAAADERVDRSRIAIIGYCFGGLCALDLARSATPLIKAAVSFHGSYSPPSIGEQPKIAAKVLVLHGWIDPITPPDATVALAHELEAAGADWQIHAYGQTRHAFTFPAANNPAGGIEYDPASDRRSWKSMTVLLAEVFADPAA
ncbi:dienelactone hydrolase [Polymorphobacter glacialis]|uniref:Dienelactone hydrolase n=1 Tax=Sandarakinorhabdus glacialis TaxID=1614636 RepID=A0A917E3Z8_9SPHN|nr:dienelactone hydrolase family protein [Polymorphobacter glacialis]GGD99256.1 dienelactone hydrolase [Polymorphobacter glacialis]